jgi:RHS repeat-associated protein
MNLHRLLACVVWFVVASTSAHAFYDPLVGRWLNRDPIGESGFERLSGSYAWHLEGEPNRYLFVGNNPISNGDPFGLDFWNCLANCIEENDPANLLAKGLLSGLGGPIPKSLVKALGGRTSGFGGHSNFTGLPRLCQRYAGPANPTFIKGVGRGASGLWIAYGNYMAAVEAGCLGSCLGDPSGHQ